MGWDVVPAGLCRTLLNIQERWNPTALYVMENGSAWEDQVEPDGRVRDERRIDYF
jgi:beta-glucosidase